MSVVLLLFDTTREIEREMNGYWWGREGERSKGIRWKSWEALYVPKKWGGMRFRKFHDFNISMLAKQAWRLIQHPNSLIVKLFKSIYYLRNSFVYASFWVGTRPSFIWRSILESKNIVKDGV